MSTSSLFQAPPGHLTLIMASRRTASFHLPSDPRFSFYLYVPRAHPVSRRARGEDIGYDGSLASTSTSNPIQSSPTTPIPPHPRGSKFPLLVVMHDSSRDAESLRDNWAQMAEEENCVVLSPHFPCDIRFPDGPDNYKRLSFTSNGKETRYDAVLFEMIECVVREWGSVEVDKFALAGFSGGGQFVHRFLYLYPQVLGAVSIGAPGRATFLVREAWPGGIVGAPRPVVRGGGGGGGFGRNRDERDEEGEEEGGFTINIEKLAKGCEDIAIQIVIGEKDTWCPVQADGSRAMSRLDATLGLVKSFEAAGIKHDFQIVQGAKHEGDRIREVMIPWMRRNLRQHM